MSLYQFPFYSNISDYPPNGSLDGANSYTVDLGFRIFGLNCNEDFVSLIL